ncbi:MAG TPA: YicC/YloC family endoribonuclease [Pontiella sp.]
MALKSMTGFGEGAAAVAGLRVSVEISSVNRKQLDINISLPRSLVTLDALLQRLVRERFSRGRISGIVRVESVGSKAGSVKIDRALAAEYIEGLRQAAGKLKLPDDLSAKDIIELPGVVSIEQESLNAEDVAALLEQAVCKALQGLNRMRLAEGKVLEKDLRARIGVLEEMIKPIRELAPAVAPSYRKKLMDRLKEAGFDDLAADDRVVKEVALYADRCDISEELTRLRSHLSQTRKLLRSSEPAGRTLDFLCQELFREINTIGSKANEVDMTRQVVAFKAELERIREQVQNVE